MPPLIVTLALQAEAEAFFDTLRQRHFPPERNFLKAHLTLFHHLPHKPEIFQDITQLSAQHQPIFLRATHVANMGRGVAYKLESDALQKLHKQWQQRWQPWLTPQDKQTLWPHVTVQNKVGPQSARNLQQQLQSDFTPFDIYGIGLRLWNYLGGPWELVETFLFRTGED